MERSEGRAPTDADEAGPPPDTVGTDTDSWVDRDTDSRVDRDIDGQVDRDIDGRVGTNTDGRIGLVTLFALLALVAIAAVGLGLIPAGVPSTLDPPSVFGPGTPAGEDASDGSSVALNETARPDATAVGPREPTADAEVPATESPVEGDTEPTATGVNATLIEREIHERINEIRRNRSLPSLTYSERLAEIAAYHSRDMAAREYFAHVGPGNETLTDRYDRFGYDCRVPITDRRYATGAENIAYTYAFTRVRTDRGVVSYDGNETRIARGIVRGWMNSPGHRQNVLRPYWEREGIGVVFDSEDDLTQVIATQNFC